MQLFRYRDGMLPDLFMFVYVIVGYPLSLYGISSGNALWYVTAIVLLAHSLVIAAHLLHKCIHQTLFKNSRLNEWLGVLLTWINGGCYSDYHYYSLGEPWYRLPRLHTEKYPVDQLTLALKKQLLEFHRYRSQRLLQAHNDDVNYGAAGVSFLADV